MAIRQRGVASAERVKALCRNAQAAKDKERALDRRLREINEQANDVTEENIVRCLVLPQSFLSF